MTSRTTSPLSPVRQPVALLVLVLAASLTACAPPEPPADPAPTFSSEAEAFAAAEATYREYVKALNAVDLSDPDTFEGVYAWTTGELNAADRESLTGHHANGVQMQGDSVVALVLLESSMLPESVRLAVCLDVSTFGLADEAGNTLTPAERDDVLALRVNLTQSESSPTGLLVNAIAPRKGAPECES